MTDDLFSYNEHNPYTMLDFTHFPDNKLYDMLFRNLVRNLGCEHCDIDPTMRFKEDLEPMGVDSLDLLETLLALEGMFDVHIDKKDCVYLKRVDHVLVFFLYGIILKRENVARGIRKTLQRKFIKTYTKFPDPIALYGNGEEKMHFN